MLKKSIRIASFLLATFTIICISQFTIIKQQQFPFDTKNRFELNLNESVLPKDKVIDDLNNLVDANQSILVKVSIDTNDYKNKKDIIWFGTDIPKTSNIIVNENNIAWLDFELTGKLISSKNIGSRPIYGTFAFDGTENFRNDLVDWAEKNNVSLSFFKRTSVFQTVWTYLFNGIGNAIITTFLLLITTIIAWIVIHAKARAIRYQNGINAKLIHIQDTGSVIKLVFSGLFTGWLVSILYLVITKGFDQAKLLIPQCIIGICFLLLLITLFTSFFSIIAKPKIKHLVDRKPPFKIFRLLGTSTQIISIVLAMLIIPSTITSASVVRELGNEYSLWENIQNSVRLSFSELDALESDTTLPQFKSFLSKMEENNNLSLSMVIDSAILLEKEEYGGYDHIILADKAWIDTFDIAIEAPNQNGYLSQIDFTKLDAPLQLFLEVQMPLWTSSKKIQPQGVTFYEFKGNKFLALSPNIGIGGTTIQAENPLVILVDNPVSTLDYVNFLIPAASSGNIVFADENLLRSSLTSSPINEYISSIDTIAGNILEQAQSFKKEAVYYILACSLICIAMIFAGLMNAILWADSHKKYIFTLHTFGITHSKIITSPLKRDLSITSCAILCGTIIAYLLKNTAIITLFAVAAGLIILYAIANFISYFIYTRKSFNKMIHREE